MKQRKQFLIGVVFELLTYLNNDYIFRYIDEHKQLSLDQPPNIGYLGHPLNGYFFVRHVGHGWTRIHDTFKNIKNPSEELTGKAKVIPKGME